MTKKGEKKERPEFHRRKENCDRNVFLASHFFLAQTCLQVIETSLLSSSAGGRQKAKGRIFSGRILTTLFEPAKQTGKKLLFSRARITVAPEISEARIRHHIVPL